MRRVFYLSILLIICMPCFAGDLQYQLKLYPCSGLFLAGTKNNDSCVPQKLLPFERNTEKPLRSWLSQSDSASLELLVDLLEKKACYNHFCDLLLHDTLVMLHLQDESNPPLYVSHGADHSLRVMNIILDIYRNSKMMQAAMTHKFPKESNYDSELLLAMLAVLHDIGYIDLISCNPLYSKFYVTKSCGYTFGVNERFKFLHAPAGATMVDNLFANLLLRLFNFDHKAERSFRYAVQAHNFDQMACSGSHPPESCHYLVTHNSHTMFLRPRATGPVEIRREYIPADLETDPLLFALRVADNADFSFDRLTQNQRKVSFIHALRKLQIDIADLTPAEKKLVGGIHDENSFSHFYSNWIVRDVHLFVGDKGSQLIVTFNGEKTPDGQIIPEALNVEVNKVSAVFQIKRMAESFLSLRVNKHDFLDDVEVVLNNFPVPGASSTRTLASFLDEDPDR